MGKIERKQILETFITADIEVQNHLKSLDEINLLYFSALYQQTQVAKSKTIPLRLFDGVGEPPPGTVVPTAVAPETWMKHLPYVSYEDLLKNSEEYKKAASQTILWIKKTQAGGGTSILRKKYLSQTLNKPLDKIKLGSKGTDLYATLPAPFNTSVPLAKVQILQSLIETQSKKFLQIRYHDIVSSETQDEVRRLWKSGIELNETFHHSGEIFQFLIPTIDDKGKLSTKRLAPGGHAFFAFEALWNGLNENPSNQNPMVSVIGNGEDLGSSPDANMVGWMAKTGVSIAMIVTEKTEVDLKGGQIALRMDNDTTQICLVEQVQAKATGQLELFEKLGLEIKKSGQKAFFNTNVALFNYTTLIPKMKVLIEKIGQPEFIKSITPDLISNKKSQTDSDGRQHTYEQLEGAMGSVLLNLDKTWRKIFKEPLVHFIYVDRQRRSQFFAPVKTAFDFFMLFHSDRFKFDRSTLRLINKKAGSLPSVNLESPSQPEFYSEVDEVLRVFEKTQIENLDSLKVTGLVNFCGMILKGDVEITNLSPTEFNLNKIDTIKSRTIENCSIHISKDDKVTLRQLKKGK